MPKYFIKTFGCQMNISDSERIASFLEKKGFVLAKKIETADLAIFNTCGIRQAAENRAYGMINNLKKQTTKNKQQKTIIMTGCLANRKDVQRRMKNSVDLFFPIDDFKLFDKFIDCHPEFISGSQKMLKHDSHAASRGVQHDTLNNNGYLSIMPNHANKFQAYVPIMTGCNNFCSYCVVPYARGREVSRKTSEIISEIKALIKKGYKQIILLGQNVNSYCDSSKNSSSEALAKEDYKITFPKLLKKINSLTGNFWVSFVSSHPKDFSDELIETIAKCKKVCEWVHLPIQAGNDKILEKMNRRYSQAHYLKLIVKIKKAFEKYKSDTLYSISSDIIVGFPGETKKQFMDSAEVMKKAEFDMVFFGQFSPRPGTAAFQMKDDVSQKEKTGREKYLNEILKKTSLANNKKYIGRTLEVLVDKKKGRDYFGHTRTMKNVKLTTVSCHPGLAPGSKNLVGKIIKAEIIKANIWNLEGKIK
jgi:tRNA-2-methylthio-N6-dimethylallyladenosine synthase